MGLKAVTKDKFFECGERVLVLPNSYAGKGFYTAILEKLVQQLDVMLESYAKIMVIRFDLRVFVYEGSNRVMETFFRRFKKWCRRNGMQKVCYLWCRERSTSDKHHYHVMVALTTKHHQQPKVILESAKYYWEFFESGSLWVPDWCYYIVRRGDDKGFQDCFSRVSYLAKVATKGGRDLYANDYSSSRLKGAA